MEATITQAMNAMLTNENRSVASLSADQPVLLVFLRHFGCIFCMEAMSDIAQHREEIQNNNVRIVMVHMSSNEIAESYFEEYKLKGIEHVSDPDCNYYAAFGLVKGTFNQLFGLKVWLRTAQLTFNDLSKLRRKQIGDGFQMPGAFLIIDGKVVNKYVHSRASDRPDYTALSAAAAVS